MRRITEMIAASGGAKAQVHVDRGYDVTVNHPGLTEWSVPVLERIAGEANVKVVDKICGSEDFSCFQKEVPGFFYFLGCTPPARDAGTAAPNHSPRFYVDEDCLKVGVKTLAGAGAGLARRQRELSAPQPAGFHGRHRRRSSGPGDCREAFR